VSRLEKIADNAISQWPLDVSMVSYVSHAEGEHIDYADGFDAFVSKDVHFELDREIRMLHWPNYQEPIPQEVFLPVDLRVLIERIVLHPQVATSPSSDIRELLRASGLSKVVVESSRDDRPVKE
jgi:hypothetical protein